MAETKSSSRPGKKPKFNFERNERTVFVGNLPSTMDHRDVEKHFKACGPIESARIRSIVPEKEKLSPKVAIITQRIHPKVDSVNAYVVFAKSDNDDSIKKALAMNGKVVDGHHIRVDRAQHPNSKRMTLTSRKKSVFVGNLRFDLRDDDLIAHFAKAGEVDYVRLVRDRATGLGKGFGFVKFMERAAVKKALEMNDADFKGRQIRVKKVDEKMKVDDENELAKQNKGSKSNNDETARQPGPNDINANRRRESKDNNNKRLPGVKQQINSNRPPQRKFDRPKHQNGKNERRVKFDLKQSNSNRQQEPRNQFNKTKITKKDKKKTIMKKKLNKGIKS